VLKGAAQIILLVDGRAEITGADRDLARMLQRLGRPLTLAVNKADTVSHEDLRERVLRARHRRCLPGFGGARHRYGRPARSCDRGVRGRRGRANAEAKSIKVAIIGRPNVGKSTLLTRHRAGARYRFPSGRHTRTR